MYIADMHSQRDNMNFFFDGYISNGYLLNILLRFFWLVVLGFFWGVGL